MAQYISKDAVLAEIEKAELKMDKIKDDSSYWIGRKHSYDDVKEFINSLEVKDVDLEKAIDDYIYTHDGRKRLALELDWKFCNLTLKGGDEIIKFAKHFFELGMAVSNKVQKGGVA